MLNNIQKITKQLMEKLESMPIKINKIKICNKKRRKMLTKNNNFNKFLNIGILSYLILLIQIFIIITPSSVNGLITPDQKFAIEAEDITAVLGSTVILPCRVNNKQGVLQWTKDDFGLGAQRNLSAFERYSMIGTDDEGDYSLKIESITLDDDAKYQCQVSPGPDGQPGIRSRFAQLTVNVPADTPIITQGEFLLVTENQEIQLECISNGGKPAADLTWIDGLGNVLTHGIKRVKEPLPDDGRRFISKSIVKIKPTKEHHNTTLMCQSQNEADKNIKTAEVKIEVKYAPQLKLSIVQQNSENNDDKQYNEDYNDNNDDEYNNNNDNEYLSEGNEAKFSCISDANPNDVTYKWFINDEFVIGDYETQMIMHNVNRTHHQAVVKCEVTNEIGTTEESIVLNVKYPPVFKQLPTSVEADDKEKIKLQCDVDGNPVEIVWVHDPIDRLNFHPHVVGTENILKITVSNETAGRYYCKANVPGFPEIKTEAYVYLKQAPQILSPQQQYGSHGDTLRLECSAFSVPKARHVSWSHDGREIDMSEDRDFSILEEPTARGIKSILVIRDGQDKHFGKFNCSVVNDYGVDVLQIELLHQNNFQFLMIIVGATSGVVILVIIVVLFLCFKLKGRNNNNSHHKNEKSYSDDLDVNPKHVGSDRCWKESDGSSHSSDYKPDIKAGSSESDYSIASTNMADSTLDIKEIRRDGSVPLAEPVELPINYRHSMDIYNYPPKYAPPNTANYGYVPTQTDYARYCMPQQQKYAANRFLPTGHNDNNSYNDVNHLQLHHQQHQPQLQQQQQQQQQLQHVPRQDNGLPGTRSSLIV